MIADQLESIAARNVTRMISANKLATPTPSTTTTTTTKSPALSTRVWKSAHFDGTAAISHPAPGNLRSYLELSMQFRAESPTGTLFYWHASARKYLAVVIESSFVKVYASLGADTTVLRSENAVSLFHWHKLEVWRSGKGVLLKINRQNWVESEVRGQRSDDVEIGGTLSIGGFGGEYPQIIGASSGFVGCMRRIRLNSRPLILTSDVNDTSVTECTISDPCHPLGCPRSCVSPTAHSPAACACEWPSYGAKCALTSSHEISAMKFKGASHLELNDEAIMSHVTGESLDLAVNFKLANSTPPAFRQILVAAGDANHEDDFFELAVTPSRFARFSMNLGSGTVVLTHPKLIEPERWTTIEVIRKNRAVTLSVNGEDPIASLAPEGAQQLNVYRNVMVGNAPAADANTDRQGFRGCVISMRFDDVIITHPKQAKAAINIEDCMI
ncbi:unnamed protein product [Caenorhabditis bovis]|uniref:Laminin G domain-containing protein n=1 Tax=Caenorhabditis bovis TaxID=2654633 RepID=A0A8S1EXK5_9PELO|nr:unnamed protein product [Caenorhabditis bovis]